MVRLNCENLTFGAPILMLLRACLDPRWNLLYFQKSHAKGSSVLLLKVYKVRFFELWELKICTAMLGQKSIVRYLARKGMNLTAIHQDLFAKPDRGGAWHPGMARILP
jgi:hypothetical protein